MSKIRISTDVNTQCVWKHIYCLKNCKTNIMDSSITRMTLSECLQGKSSNKKPHFEQFFQNWFRRQGKVFTFIFRKNLKVTNIQFAELVSLIRQFSYWEKDEYFNDNMSKKLQFASVDEFKNSINNIVNSFPDKPYCGKSYENLSRWDYISKKYRSIISNYIVIESFYGSCTVYIPPSLGLDLKELCAHSGYIYACGKNLYISNAENSKYDDLHSVLKLYGDSLDFVESEEKILFKVFSHTDKGDLSLADGVNLDSGNDQLKIHTNKFYMDGKKLVEVLKDLSNDSEIKKSIYVDLHGLINSKNPDLPGKMPRNKNKTLWMLSDYSINYSTLEKGKTRFFICYEQEFKNENPIYRFDEDKPAWVAPITIPHTLMAAMVNIVEPKISPTKSVKLLDPFCGSGTIYFEANKYFNISISCRDISDFSEIMMQDNIDFFGDIEKLKSLKNDFSINKRIKKRDNHDIIPKDSNLGKKEEEDRVSKSFSNSMDLLIEVLENNKSGHEVLTDKYLRRLKDLDYYGRINFYIGLKIYNKYYSVPYGVNEGWSTYFESHVSILCKKIDHLLNVYSRVKNIKKKAKVTDVIYCDEYIEYQGTYSICCTVQIFNKQRMNDERFEEVFKRVAVEDIKEEKFYDVIITDPPYGFNTVEAPNILADLYCDLIDKILYALKDDGQLILSLPDRSYNGQKLHSFILKEFIIPQILVRAQSYNKVAVNPVFSVPYLGGLFHPPYYWESERALRRSILHFKFSGIQDEKTRSLILRQLTRRIGELSPEMRLQIQSLSLTQLETLGEALLDFTEPADLLNCLRSSAFS